MIRYGLVTSALLAVASCGPDSRDPGGSPDASKQPDGPPQCYESSVDVDVTLAVQIEESCAIWNSLTMLEGRARVSRVGTMLTIDFGLGVVFTGTATNGTVNLVYTHPHTFTDGCGWQATETLAGQLDPTSCDFSLRYDYAESVVMNNGGCATPCSAQADVTLELKPVIL